MEGGEADLLWSRLFGHTQSKKSKSQPACRLSYQSAARFRELKSHEGILSLFGPAAFRDYVSMDKKGDRSQEQIFKIYSSLFVYFEKKQKKKVKKGLMINL